MPPSPAHAALQGYDLAAIRQSVVGIDVQVPTLSGIIKPYINLDNAASTPTLRCVLDAVNQAMPYYSSIHRGAGYKSQLSTALYEGARAAVLRFVGGDAAQHAVIFGKNATEVINALAYHIGQDPDGIVLSTVIEHHANLLPWRMHTQLHYVEVDEHGSMDLADLERQLQMYGKRVKVVAVCGGSNVTGCVPPVHEVARIAHRYGTQILVDAAQLAPHRAIDMGTPGHDDALDYIVFSAHKMYAPFGTGVLVGPPAIFESSPPAIVGGGTVDIVMEDEIIWSDAPHRQEAGSPNVVGAIALTAAINEMERLGMDAIAAHEKELTTYALDRLDEVPGIEIYGCASLANHDRLGVISFNLAGHHHARVAAILTYEHAVAVRNGCFCAHPYLLRLLEMSQHDTHECREKIRRHDYSAIPGAVRLSFGIYSTHADVDTAVEALKIVAAGKEQGSYTLEKEAGQYFPDNFRFDFTDVEWAKPLI